jgi:hypothetical protein
MRRVASAGASESRPARLMQRLALLPASEDAAEAGRGRSLRTVLFFALGILGGALIGAAALLALNMAWGAQLRDLGNRGLGVFAAALAPLVGGIEALVAHAPPRAHAPATATLPLQQPESFDVVIDRRVKIRAAFGLRLVGSDDRRLQVLLRDVPTTAALSHGAQQDASSWIVGAADLEHLHLTLADGTPDAFDIRIDVLARSDVAAVGSVARVRVVDVPGKDPASMIAAVAQRDTVVPSALAVAAPQVQKARGRAREDKGKAINVAAPASAANQRHWPDGASGLGAVPPSIERQVWWKMPPPSWSPFQEPAANTLP